MNKIDKKRILKRSQERKSIVMSIRITPRMSKFLQENNYSPTGIFNIAMENLGYK